MWLTCSNRCGSKLFRALFAEVDVDSDGNYQDHRITQAGYLCLNCGSPALDLGEVPREMAAEREAERAAPTVDVLCPVCETLVEVSPGTDCPNCHAPLEIA
jgi:hypothetical protein